MQFLEKLWEMLENIEILNLPHQKQIYENNKKRIQPFVNNIVNSLHHEIKLKNSGKSKRKITFLLSKTFLFYFNQKYMFFTLEKMFLRILKIQFP